MDILEKVAYLKGLAEGMELEAAGTKESKLLLKMLDLLEDFALEMREMQDDQDELEEALDVISDDLAEVETYLYESEDDEDEDDDDDCCCCDDDDDCCCCDEEEDECYETVCPVCEEHIYFDEGILEEGFVLCTNCGEKLEFDLSEIEDVCCEDCDCED